MGKAFKDNIIGSSKVSRNAHDCVVDVDSCGNDDMQQYAVPMIDRTTMVVFDLLD
jgi:hypothetical protein